MKSRDLDSFGNSGSGRAAASLTERWARSAMLRLLAQLKHGSLTLEEGGQVLHFGETRQQASLRATIHVRDASTWLALLRNGSIGAGEAYMQEKWDTPDLLQVVRLFVANMAVLQRLERSALRRHALRLWHWLRHNSRSGARRNIAAHYDLGNDFFRLFLDDTMAYSAGIFARATDSLHDASLAKFDRICTQLRLQPDDHLLEIGTGWGGLAIHAARHYGCRVTTTTLSREQAAYARAWIAREGLGERISVLEQDYRELDGSFDKLVSVEMIEAVGARYYPDYFRRCSQLLKPHGLMMLQAITISDQRYAASVAGTDFIKRYVFPGGQLPCNSEITRQVALHTDMQLVDLKDITYDYALTLRAWRERFQNSLADARQLGYDETFLRMWRFYLCFCEGGFLERVIHTGQFLLAKPGWRPVGE
ncbi:MAG: cyclopropane-fatty-acyl-phospholipid synthase family protein [Pseudomonadota bacterium]|nr:cyclopropane-fatty-acyl-phospholipid synthase family protein [Pseudomonadota bacterium]